MATDVLHSHSALERELNIPKKFVLVDARFSSLFLGDTIAPYKHRNMLYYRVPVLSFVFKGGVFKNYSV